MEEAGVNTDYIEYMMGHVVNTYHDVQNLPIEKLRNAYEASDLSIRPKTKVGKSELVKLLKEVIRAHGRNPEEILGREALMEGATTHVGIDHLDQHLQVLARTLGDLLRNGVSQQALQQGSDR